MTGVIDEHQACVGDRSSQLLLGGDVTLFKRWTGNEERELAKSRS